MKDISSRSRIAHVFHIPCFPDCISLTFLWPSFWQHLLLIYVLTSHGKKQRQNSLTNPDQPLRQYIQKPTYFKVLFLPFFNCQNVHIKGFQTQIGFLAITTLVSMPCLSKSHLKQNKLFLPPVKVKTAEILSPEFDALEQENTSKGVTRATASLLNISILWMDFTISHQFDLIMIDDRFAVVLFEPVF